MILVQPTLRTLPKLLAAVAVLAGTVVLTTPASAASLKLNLTSYSNGAGLGGGVYSAVPVSGALDLSHYHTSALYGAGFGTFCLEYSEHFNPGTTYAYTKASSATLGSGGAVGGEDPISNGTAWLYYQFATGSLAGYNYTDKSSALALQLAFWFLEDEVSVMPTTLIGGVRYGGGSPTYNYLANPFVSLALTTFGDLTAAKSHAEKKAFGVEVLNLTSVVKGETKHHQSQLYFSGYTPPPPPPPPSVPDATTTASLLGLGLALTAVLRRRLG
jgi:hypothetical protein